MKLSHISSTKSRPFSYDSQILSNQQNLAKMDSGGGWGQDMRQATYDVRGDITTFRLSPVACRTSHVGRACRLSPVACPKPPPRRPHAIGKAFAWSFGLPSPKAPRQRKCIRLALGSCARSLAVRALCAHPRKSNASHMAFAPHKRRATALARERPIAKHSTFPPPTPSPNNN